MRVRAKDEITHIIIHMSAVEDGANYNVPSIFRYHTSYRYNYKIISKKEALKLISEGKRVERPWPDVGYHFLVENVGGEYYITIGRDIFNTAAACYQKDMNIHGIHICFLGDYDKTKPSDKMQLIAIKKVVVPCMRLFNIDINNIEPHRKYANKTCPGKMFDMKHFKNLISKEMLI